MSKQDWGWWAGSNDEIFNIGGPFETREIAISEGRANDPSSGFFICEALQHQVRFNAERLVESQYFEDDDLFDQDHVEPDRVGPKDQIAVADAELQALLDAWVDKWRRTFIAPNMFAASRNQEWIAPEGGDEVEVSA